MRETRESLEGNGMGRHHGRRGLAKWGLWALILVSLVWFRPVWAGEGAKAIQHAPCRKNVVLIVIDTLRADRLRAERNGIPLMPNLAALADRSLCFTNTAAQATWTKPSMVSILTSLYPTTHRIEFGIQKRILEIQEPVVEGVPDELETMAEYLQAAGYRTVAIQTNHQLKAAHGFRQGFDVYRFEPPKANIVTDIAIEELAHIREPFLLYLHYFDPHHPYAPPERYRTMFEPQPQPSRADLELLAGYRDYYLDRIFYDLDMRDTRKQGSFSAKGREYVRRLYDGDVRFTDDEVGRFVHHLEQRFPDSLVVVTADHGEEFWEHGSIGHGRTVFEEQVHVPLIIRLPGWEAREVTARVETIDILPTLAGYLGLPPSPRWQGVDLIPFLQKVTLPERPVFSETRGSLAVFNLHSESVAVGTSKVIVDHTSAGPQFALYDLASDPAERHNLAAQRGNEMMRLVQLLARHNTEAQAHELSKVGPARFSLDKDTFDGLRALGYLGGD